MTEWGFGHRGWIVLGLVSGLLALEFAPLVSGALALYAATQLYRYQNKSRALFVAVFGIICTIVGVLHDVSALSPF